MSGGFDVVGASFAARRNILSARPFQNLLGPLDPLRILAVNREQNAAVFNPAFVAFRFIFGNPHANQRARDATDGPSYASARQCSHNGSGRDKRPQTRNRKCTHAEQPSHRAAEYYSGSSTRGRSFWRFSAFLVGKIFCARAFWK